MRRSSGQAMSETTARRHIPALDGMRGVAILLVIAFHAHELRIGWVGVDVFFVLSGFLITGILVSAKDGPHYFRSFWGRRVLRIVPPYAGYLLLVLVLLPVFGLAPKPEGVAWVMSYLTNVRMAWMGQEHGVPVHTYHLWSVAVEEQFYLVWPLVVYALSTNALRRICVWGIGGALVFRVALLIGGADWTARYVLTPARLDTLLVGAWLATTQTRTVPRWLLMIAVLTLGAMGVGGASAETALMSTLGYSVIALASGTLLAGLLTEPWLARVLGWRPLRMAGRYSYTAYLLHPMVIAELHTRFFPIYTRRFLLLVTAMTFALAWLSWRIYEEPLLRLKRFFPEPAVFPPALHESAARPVIANA